MWCWFTNQERACFGTCQSGCPYGYEMGLSHSNFNYECPNCKGKFNVAVYEYCPISGITDGGGNSSGRYAYVCPFCGQEMKGLN